MSQKQTTDTSVKYSPTGMNAYNSLTPQAQQGLSDFMQNPLQSTGFQRNLGMQQKFINQAGQAHQQNITGNQAALGMAGRPMSGFAQAQSANQARLTTGEGSNAFTNLLNYANQQRMSATQTASAFQPLQTGQTTTQQTSGLGSWLPQLVGGAAGMAMNAFMPGTSFMKAAGTASKAGAGVANMGALNFGGANNFNTGSSPFSQFLPQASSSGGAYRIGG